MKNYSQTEFDEMLADFGKQAGGKTVLTLQEASNLSGYSIMTFRRAIWERSLKVSQPRTRGKYLITLRNLVKFILGDDEPK